MKKALVLNSGGVDSTTCVALAVKKFGAKNVATVSIFYGQKHSKELVCANMIAQHYGVMHYQLDLHGVLKYSNCPLLADSTEEINHASYADQIANDGDGMVRTYVPFRNGLMLSSVAALAMSIYPEDETSIYLGAHADDAAGQAYADCSSAFSHAMEKAISIGTYNKVHVVAPFINMTKAEVVKTGLALKTPYNLTWSCYEGNELACGTCGTCIDRQNAFISNGTIDPILYEHRVSNDLNREEK